MLNKKDAEILNLIINHTERIIEKTKDLTYEQFINDIDVKEITAFHILQIGELAKKLTTTFTTEFNEIPWKEIKGMRDCIAHGYETISFNRVWDSSINDVPKLSAQCNEILKK